MLGLTALGVLLLIAGFFLYAQAAPNWQQAQSLIGQLAGMLSPSVQQQIDSVRMAYFGSIGAMILGGLLTLVGLLNARSAPVAQHSDQRVGDAPATQEWYERPGSTWSKWIGVLAVVVLLLVIAGGREQLTRFYAGNPPTVSSQSETRPDLVQPAPAAEPSPVVATAPSPDTSRVYVQEAVDDLVVMRNGEWAYFQRYGAFSRNMRTVGFSSPVGSHFYLSIPRADSSQVTLRAVGKILTPASDIRLALILNSDGTNRLLRER